MGWGGAGVGAVGCGVRVQGLGCGGVGVRVCEGR